MHTANGSFAELRVSRMFIQGFFRELISEVQVTRTSTAQYVSRLLSR
jgi:hypothetical protein